MLGKRPRSVIGKLSELLVSGSAGLLESAVAAAAASPRSPLDLKIQSPRGPRSYDLGGVGLGIVAALEKPGDARILLLPKNCACRLGSARPGPNRAGGPGRAETRVRAGAADDDMADYTYVTFHGPDQSLTMVYYGEGECDGIGGGGCGKSGGGLGESMRRAGGGGGGGGKGPVFQTLDFLNSCQLCGKKLHGEDTYMYRGEKAFCSAECRSTQIMKDERKEQCRSGAPRVADRSGSPYSEGLIFSTSILAI